MTANSQSELPGQTWKVGALARATGLTVRTLHPLIQICEVLAQPEWQLAPAIERHLADARRRAAMAAGLCARLAALAAELADQADVSPEQLFSTVEPSIGKCGPASR